MPGNVQYYKLGKLLLSSYCVVFQDVGTAPEATREPPLPRCLSALPYRPAEGQKPDELPQPGCVYRPEPVVSTPQQWHAPTVRQHEGGYRASWGTVSPGDI